MFLLITNSTRVGTLSCLMSMGSKTIVTPKKRYFGFTEDLRQRLRLVASFRQAIQKGLLGFLPMKKSRR